MTLAFQAAATKSPQGGDTGRILALDSATSQCSVALWIDGSVRQLIADSAVRNSEAMLPMVQRILADAQLRVADLDAVAFGAGPGAFTGLRVACGVAQGLAFAADLPVVPVGTLDSLAETIHPEGRQHGSRVLVAMDARMQECYWGLLQGQADDWALLDGPSLSSPDRLQVPADGDWLALGDAFLVLAAGLPGRSAGRVSLLNGFARQPEAAAVATLAHARWRAGGGLAAEAAHPWYVRDKVALTSAERGMA